MQSQEKIDIKNHINTNSKTNSYAQGQYKLTCPSCGSSRKKKRDTPLSVNINAETIVYHCHHCGINGAIARNQGVKMAIVKTEPTPVKKKPINLPTPDKQAETWLLERGISIETANASGCVLGKKNNKPVIGFSFTEGDETVAVKWRSANGTKDFWWDNNATRLWGLQNHDEKLPTIEKTLVITEGELDCLAIKEAFKDHSNIDVYSVPNGAPNKITDIVDPKEDKRFKYVWDDREKFEGVDRIILATDTDTNGQLLADELARRLNKARCYTVDYLGSKDANDLLVKTDAETVRKQILNAEPVPLHGLNNIEHYADEFQSLYEQGKPRGVSTGFDSVDELFTLQTGYLNIVTGYPGDGKSAFIDQIVVNVAKNYGWKTCFCSFEKPPTLHSVQLAQVLVGKPFFEGQNERMNQEEKDFAESWINEHILFQDYQDGGMPTIESILEKGASAVMRYGVRILVIDPFNFIQTDHKGLETDMVSDMLTKVQLFCKQHDVCCFFVAHPTKPAERGKKQIVTGVDVAKSMAWFSKADMGLTVFRGDSSVSVNVWKARWGWSAKCGTTDLTFNPLSGRYSEAEEIEDDYDWTF
mgnify:FL=1